MVEVLEEADVEFDDGMTDDELVVIENRFDFRFPPDLATFLKCGLAVGGPFPDWRNDSEERLREMFELPFREILFDVEHNNFWLPEWGEQPTTATDSKNKLRQLIDKAPNLVPVYGSHMMPDRPCLEGNPVFAIRQTDIVYYGSDLRDWFVRSFLCSSDCGLWPMSEGMRTDIEFWDPSRFATRWDTGPLTYDNSKGYLP